MRTAGYLAGLLGLTLLVTLVLRGDAPAMLQSLSSAGWRLLWLVPYRALYFLLYAIGWCYLLRPYDTGRHVSLSYVFWATSVREAIDRLLPVASVGGGVVGVRLLRWRGLSGAAVSATVIVEIVLTLLASYAFTAVGLMLLLDLTTASSGYRRFLEIFLLSLPIPVATLLLLRYGSVFARLQKFVRPFVGADALSDGAASLDREVRACLGRWRSTLTAGLLQLAALMTGSFEVWFALRLFGHPVDVATAIVLESLTQAMRHAAFMVPAGVGIQEGALVLFGHALGLSGELALAVSMAKRVREILCGLPALLSWQWLEGRRLRRT